MKDAVKKVGAELARVRFGPHHAPSAPRAAAACQVIAAMTVGKDVSSLFPDVLNCMQTGARPAPGPDLARPPFPPPPPPLTRAVPPPSSRSGA